MSFDFVTIVAATTFAASLTTTTEAATVSATTVAVHDVRAMQLRRVHRWGRATLIGLEPVDVLLQAFVILHDGLDLSAEFLRVIRMGYAATGAVAAATATTATGHRWNVLCP